MTKQRASMRDRPITVQTSQPRQTDDTMMGKERASQKVEELLLSEIMPNQRQPRTRPSEEGLEELAASIREHGVIQPVIVREIGLTLYDGTGRRYELIAGERRWRASAKAGKDSIPAIVFGSKPDDHAMLELAIIENLQREDLHPLDEAMAFERMQTELGYSYAQIGERLGKSKGYVQNRMRLLSLDDDLQQLVAERPDTLGHVYELSRISAEARSELIAAVRDDALSRAETRARVEQILRPAPPESPPAPSQAEGAYFQKYDQERRASADRSADEESYFQKYGQEQPDNSAMPANAHPEGAPSLLNGRERALIAGLVVKVKQTLDAPERLTEDDWAMLAPLGESLSELLRRRS